MRSKLSLISITLCLAGIAHADDAKESVRLTFDYPIEWALPTDQGLGDRTAVAAGQELVLPREKLVWIQAKGKVPMLLVPHLPSDADHAKIQLPDVAAWPPASVTQEIENKVSAMIEDITAFQVAVRKRDVKEAEKILSRLEATQKIAYLSFLRATLDFVKGDLENARINVKKGLQRYPANEQGLQLLKNLGEPQQ